MKKVLIAVDDALDSRAMVSALHKQSRLPEEIVLLQVQRLQGKSRMIDMLGDAEMATLREQLEGTEHKGRLDCQAEKILHRYAEAFQDGRFRIKTMVREGLPLEVILQVADEEAADLIILGSGKRRGVDRLISGDIAEELQRSAKVPVWVAQTTRKVYGRAGSFLFFLFWLVLGIYYGAVKLMELGGSLFATSEFPSLFVYSLMSAGVLLLGIIVASIGGFMGWLLVFGDRVKITRKYYPARFRTH